ncbi:KxYKxGKxW signal peptide domain-containing protein [Priestia aryabhattai]|nr:KxYKxGKxW signal peptide domain-containing protein [Priestia aryabhattai]
MIKPLLNRGIKTFKRGKNWLFGPLSFLMFIFE